MLRDAFSTRLVCGESAWRMAPPLHLHHPFNNLLSRTACSPCCKPGSWHPAPRQALVLQVRRRPGWRPLRPRCPGVLSQLLPVTRPRLTQPDSAAPFPGPGPGRREAVRPSWSLSWWRFLSRDPRGAGLQMVRLRCSPWTPGSQQEQRVLS